MTDDDGRILFGTQQNIQYFQQQQQKSANFQKYKQMNKIPNSIFVLPKEKSGIKSECIWKYLKLVDFN